MGDKLNFAVSEASRHMEAIQGLFNKGAKITLLVRTPGYDERDFCLTDDSLDEAIAALQRRRKAGEDGE